MGELQRDKERSLVCCKEIEGSFGSGAQAEMEPEL